MKKLGTKRILPVYGFYKPTERRINNKKVWGWTTSNKCGGSLSFHDTYNDVAEVKIIGNSVQKCEWINRLGLTTQSGTPSPDNPIPLVTNLPSGTYKVKDYKDDWYEFSLPCDLHGNGEIQDSIDFDRYSHKGFLRINYNKTVFDGSADEDWKWNSNNTVFVSITLSPIGTFVPQTTVPNIKSTHYPVDAFQNLYTAKVDYGISYGSSGADRICVRNKSINTVDDFISYLQTNPLTVLYKLETPAITPITFTKNNNSTAPECPMNFLTDTPSIDYPTTVYDAVGTVTSRGKNLFNFGKIEDYTVYAPLVTQMNIDTNNLNLSGISQNGAMSFVLKNQFFSNNGESFNLSGQFSGIVRWLVRMYDINKNNISNTKSLAGATYNSVYNAFYTSSSPFTFRIPYEDVKYFQIGFVFFSDAGVGTRQYLIKPQLQINSSASAFEPYFGEPVTLEVPLLRKVGNIADEYIPKSGKVIRKIGYIESYNGEPVSGEYISTTGGLDTGAEVRYVLPEPIEEQLSSLPLPTFPKTTIIDSKSETISEFEIEATVKVAD